MLQAMELRLKPEHPDIIRMKRTIGNGTEAEEEESQRPLSPTAAQSARSTTPFEAARQERLKLMQVELESIDRQIAFKEAEESGCARRCRTTRPARGGSGLESEWVALTRDYDTLQRAYQNSSPRARTRRSPPTSNGGRSASSSGFWIRPTCPSGPRARIG